MLNNKIFINDLRNRADIYLHDYGKYCFMLGRISMLKNEKEIYKIIMKDLRKDIIDYIICFINKNRPIVYFDILDHKN